jgi:hypothetical protein
MAALLKFSRFRFRVIGAVEHPWGGNPHFTAAVEEQNKG